MARRLLLHTDRLMSLNIIISQMFKFRKNMAETGPFLLGLIPFSGKIRASEIQKIFCRVQVGLFPGDPIQLHKGQFNLRMARTAMDLFRFRAEGAADIVRHPDRQIQQLSFSGIFIVCRRRLDHMPGYIQFMAFPQVAPAVSRLFDCIVGIQIPVFLLGLPEKIHRLVRSRLQFRQFGSG